VSVYGPSWNADRRDPRTDADASIARLRPMTIPGGVNCVVVRGHDQTHGYGGRAMLVNLDTGATRGIDQGPEPATFEGADCP